MKKFLSLLLVLIFSAVALSACSTDEIKNSDTGDVVEKMDLGGTEYIILQTQHEVNSVVMDNVLGYEVNTQLGDNALQRLKDIEAAYNCKITLEDRKHAGPFTQAVTAAMATGDHLADILHTSSQSIRPIAKAGGCVPLDDVSDIIDYTDYDKWGGPNEQEMSMCYGVRYGVVPVRWIFKASSAYYMIAVNSDIVQMMNQPDPREYLEKKEWTREKLVECIVNYTDLSREPKIFGMAVEPSHFVRMAIMGNNVKLAAVAEDGTIKSGWNTPGAVDAVTWVRDLLEQHKDKFYNRMASADPWSYYDKPFMKGEAAMYLTSAWKILNEIAYDMENFAIMPFPAGPMAEYGEWPGFYEETGTVAIPTFTDDPIVSANLINDIFEPLEAYPDKNSILNYYKTNVFLDPRDAEVFFSNQKYAQYSYWVEGGDAVVGTAVQAVTGKKSPAEALSATVDVMQKVIDSDILANWIAMDKNGMGKYAAEHNIVVE